jgi:glycosyltransferase involved in cell wall biosynthesis
MIRVSVVIPCYNAAHTIERAVLSAFAQTLQPHEVIVVDDVSNDESREILARLERLQTGLRVVRQSVNEGPAAARNRGLELAAGNWVAFLDADDEWVATKLQIQADWMNQNPACALSGHQVGAAGESGAVPGLDGHVEWVGRDRLLRGNPFVTSSVMVRADANVRFDPGQRFSEEFAVWLRMVCVDGMGAAVILLPLAVRHTTGGGLSSHLVAMERAELGNFSATRRAGGITTAQWVVASALSIAKFLRRAVMRALR